MKEFKVVSAVFNNSSLTELIFKIRQEVFVIEQQVSREEEFDEFEKSSVHYLGYMDQVPCATARWRITAEGIKLERFAVLKSFRDKGAGGAVLQKVLQDVLPAGQKIYLHAQLKAVNFYERAGFKKEGPMFNEANIDHFKMYYDKSFI